MYHPSVMNAITFYQSEIASHQRELQKQEKAMSKVQAQLAGEKEAREDESTEENRCSVARDTGTD